MLTCGLTLYEKCCETYSLKPNQHIKAQVSRTDLLHLKKIDASQTFLGSLGVHAVLDFVEAHRGIAEINLQQNGLDQSCVEHLCKVLRGGHPCLSSIDLSNNPLCTASVRLLWETIQQVHTVKTLTLDKCGVTDEWSKRLSYALTYNTQFDASSDDDEAANVPPYDGWSLIFILVIGDEGNVTQFCDHVLMPLGSYLAPRRVRIAPVVITAEDHAHLVETKVQMCCDQNNGGYPWCVTFFDRSPLTDAQRLALSKVLNFQGTGDEQQQQHQMDGSFDEIIPPRPGFFPFAVPAEVHQFNKEKHIPAREYLRILGYDRLQSESLGDTIGGPGAPVLSHQSELIVRCQSDLYSAISELYSDKSQLPPVEDDAELPIEEHKLKGAIGKLHDKAVKAVLYYVNNKEMEKTTPLLIYGDSGIGKGNIISHIAGLLLEKNEKNENDATETPRVVTYSVGERPDSIALFLYFVLSLFNPNASLEFESLDQLCTVVRETIANYDGQPIVFLVSHLSEIDTSGSASTLIIDWMPHSLPGNVKIVVTVRNGHPAVNALRQRCPQPFECLCSVLPGRHLVNLYKQELFNRGLTLPGLHDFTRSVRDAFTDAESAYLQKEGSSDVVFSKLAAAHTECLIKIFGSPRSESEVLELIAQVPNSIEKVVEKLCDYVATLNDRTVVAYVGLSLAACSLPVTDLLFICEEMGPCAKHSAGVTIREMIKLGLVLFGKTSSIASLSHPSVRDAVTNLFVEEANRVSVIVEQHLQRLVLTLSPEITWAFRGLVPLMLANGNFNGLKDLLENSIAVDAILCASKRNQVYLIDAFFRLLASNELLSELTAADLPVNVQISPVELAKGLTLVQRHQYNFFQELLLYGDASPLVHDAQRNTACANYVVVTPNNKGAEDTSTQCLRCDGVGLYCHGREDFVCAATAETVMVFSVKNGACVAQRYIPFKRDSIVGVLMAAHCKVIVLGRNGIFLWDFPINNLHTLEGFRTAVDPLNLNAEGNLLLVQHIASGALEVVNLNTKQTVAQIALSVNNFCSASFFGDFILLRKNSKLHIFDKKIAEVCVLPHDGAVGAACATADGRMVVTSVGGTIWVWTFSGSLIHRIDAGPCPITSLGMDESGSLLLTTQSSGVHLWKVMSGTLLAKLNTKANRSITKPRFTEDKTKVYAYTGAVLNVWETQTGACIGAVASPKGFFTSIFEADGILYTTSTASDLIRLWDLSGPITTEREVLEGSITTNWLKNSKISKHSIVSISTESHGEIIVCVDESKKLHVYSLSTGEKLETNVGANSVSSAIAIDSSTIVYTQEGSLSVFYIDLYSLAEVSYPLPKTTLPESTLHLIPSLDGVFAVNVTSQYSSALLVCEERKNRSEFWNLNHHNGRVLTACFFGSFMYSIGAEDRNIYLWTVCRRANRASYEHPLNIISASCSSTGILIIVDESGTVYRITTTSLHSSRASLLAVKLSDAYPLIKPLFDDFPMRSVVCLNHFVFFVTSRQSLAMIDLSVDGRPNLARTTYKTTCIHAATLGKGGEDILYVGTCNGDAYACRILVPTEIPKLLDDA